MLALPVHAEEKKTKVVSEKELVGWARERMADYKAPRQVKIVDGLPRTGTDKVQKEELLKLFLDEGAGSEGG